MKIKFNEVKETTTLKGMTFEQLELIWALVGNVRLGQPSRYSEAAYQIANAFAECGLGDFSNVTEDVDFKVFSGATGEYVEDPTIEV